MLRPPSSRLLFPRTVAPIASNITTKVEVFIPPAVDLGFEEVSAFCTVGLTVGITSGLGIPAQVVLMISMFVGRVGTLTLAFALASRTASTSYR